MSTFQQIKEAVIWRHARLANSLDVQPADEFAERLLGLELALQAEAMDATVSTDATLLDSFMDRTSELRSLVAR